MTSAQSHAFFDWHRAALQRSAEAGGAPGVVAYVQALADPRERQALYASCRLALCDPAWAGHSLDLFLAVARAGIEEMLRQAAAAPSAEARADALRAADSLSFDLAVGLADCPAEEPPHRTDAHFEAGLRAAEDCLRWRTEAGGGSGWRAWWVKGLHLLSLGHLPDATEAFLAMREHAQAAAGNEGEVPLRLAEAHLALSRWKGGAAGGEEAARLALAEAAALCGGPGASEEARLALTRLEHVFRRHAPPPAQA